MVKYRVAAVLSGLTLSASDSLHKKTSQEQLDEKVQATCDKVHRLQDAYLLKEWQQLAHKQSQMVKESAYVVHDVNNTLEQMVQIMKENEKKPQENEKKSE